MATVRLLKQQIYWFFSDIHDRTGLFPRLNRIHRKVEKKFQKHLLNDFVE